MASGGVELEERRSQLTVNNLFGPDDINDDSDFDGSDDMEIVELPYKVYKSVLLNTFLWIHQNTLPEPYITRPHQTNTSPDVH